MKPVFFVHIPSCGGTTMWSLLRKQYGRDHTWRRMPKTRQRFDSAVKQSATLAQYTALGGHITLSESLEIDPDRKRFTFVRDPVARIQSAYARQVRNGKWVPDDPDDPTDILRFASHGIQPKVMRLYLSPDGIDGPLDLGTIADFVENRMDAVCLTEDFDRSLFLLADVLGWPSVPHYLRKNIGGTKRASYPAEVLDGLREILADEIAIYDLCRKRYQDQIAALGDAVSDEAVAAYRARNKAREERLIKMNFGRNPQIKTGKKKRRAARRLWPFSR